VLSLAEAVRKLREDVLAQFNAGSLPRLVADLLFTQLVEHAELGVEQSATTTAISLRQDAELRQGADHRRNAAKQPFTKHDYTGAEIATASSIAKAIRAVRKRLPIKRDFLLHDGSPHAVTVSGVGSLRNPVTELARRGEELVDDSSGGELGLRLIVEPPIAMEAGGTTFMPAPSLPAQTTSPIVHLYAQSVHIYREPLPGVLDANAAFVRMEQGIGYIARIYKQHLISRFDERHEPYPITYLFDDAFEDGEQYDLVFIPALFDWNLSVASLIETYSRPGEPVIRRLLPIPSERDDNDIEFIKFAINYHLLFGTALHTIFVPPRSRFLQSEFGTDASSFTAGGLFIQMDEMYEREGDVIPRPKTDRKKVAEFFHRIEHLGDHAHLLRYNDLTFTHTPDPSLEEMWSPFLRDLQANACAVCSEPLDPGALDHIVPLPTGNNSLINLRMVCRRQGHEHTIADLPRIDLTRIIQRRMYTNTVLEPSLELLKQLTDRTLAGVPIVPRWRAAGDCRRVLPVHRRGCGAAPARIRITARALLRLPALRI
jgi:hypothetical protein